MEQIKVTPSYRKENDKRIKSLQKQNEEKVDMFKTEGWQFQTI